MGVPQGNAPLKHLRHRKFADADKELRYVGRVMLNNSVAWHKQQIGEQN